MLPRRQLGTSPRGDGLEVDEPEDDSMALLMSGEVDRPKADDMDEERMLRALMDAQGRD